MDSSISESADGSAHLSLSLVSYGSDVEDVDSLIPSSINLSGTLVSHSVTDDSEAKRTVSSNLSDEDSLILSVAEQCGLSGLSLEKLEQVSLALKSMKSAQQMYLQTKVKFDALVNVAKTSTKLPAQTAQKIREALDRNSLLDYVTPPDVDLTDGVFGISQRHLLEHFPSTLSVVDIKHLQEACEEEISLKYQKILHLENRHNEMLQSIIGPSVCDSDTLAEQTSTSELLTLRRELDREMSAHDASLKTLDSILSSLAKIKLESYHVANNNLLDSHSSRCDQLAAQVQAFNDQISYGIYSEDEHLIEAFTSLKRNLDLAIMEATSKLSMLQQKNFDYDKLRGTQFDRLVEDYCSLKNQIAQKEYALKNLLS